MHFTLKLDLQPQGRTFDGRDYLLSHHRQAEIGCLIDLAYRIVHSRVSGFHLIASFRHLDRKYLASQIERKRSARL